MIAARGGCSAFLREDFELLTRTPAERSPDVISGEHDILMKVRGESMESIGSLVIDKIRQMDGVGKTLTCACFATVYPGQHGRESAFNIAGCQR